AQVGKPRTSWRAWGYGCQAVERGPAWFKRQWRPAGAATARTALQGAAVVRHPVWRAGWGRGAGRRGAMRAAGQPGPRWIRAKTSVQPFAAATDERGQRRAQGAPLLGAGAWGLKSRWGRLSSGSSIGQTSFDSCDKMDQRSAAPGGSDDGNAIGAGGGS